MKHYVLINFLVFIALFSSFQVAYANEIQDVSLTEQIAAGNDWLIDKGQKKKFLFPVTWVTSRTMSVTLFPLCTAVDIAVLATKQVKETPHILLNKDSSQHDIHLDQFRKNNQEIKRRSLGLIAAPMGLLSPDIVSQHFVPGNVPANTVEPYGKLYSTQAHVFYPESAEDVQMIVIEAGVTNKSISTIGKGMSQGKQAISNNDWNIVVNTSKMNRIEIDPILKLAKVGAGATWADLQREANKHGLAVRVMQASNVFSIGGSLSVNCHGWDHHTGSVRNTLIEITIVDSQGRILQLTPDDPLFDYIVGGYGGFGIIVEATLSLTDNVKLIRKGVEVAPKDYIDYFNHNIRHNDNVAMHLYRLSLERNHFFETGIAVNYEKSGNDALVADLIDEPARGTILDRIKIHTLRRISLLRNFAWSVEKNGALEEEATSRNEHMRPPINPVFNNSKVDTEWLQEYFVKEEDLADFLRFLGDVLNKNKVAVFNASVRFVKHDPKTQLSYAPTEDRFAIVLFFNQKLTRKEIQKTKTWVRQVVDYLVTHGGTFYLPYQHFATKEQFRACYVNCDSIASYKKMVDPDGVFDNGLYDDYITAENGTNSLFRQVFDRVGGQREGIRDFLNNIFMQLDEKMFFQVMDSILENSQIDDEQIYVRLFNKIGKAKPNVASRLHLTLRSLKCLKNDLGDQTLTLLGSKKINGYVEIGYPGRMTKPLKKRLNISGPYYTVSDQENLSDYVEAGFPRPYDRFIPLNDYKPISENDVPSGSVDLVCLYIGLHHIPEDKIDSYIESIKRMLRPGGTFILMDHDAYTKELQIFVDVVHSIFNAATGVDPEKNAGEVRNFHSLQYWSDRVQAHGLFRSSHEPLVRAGDSTINSLVRFDKPKEETIEAIIESLSSNESYKRSQKQTYLTAPEWQNVRAAQHYAAFVENNPAYHYPYFSEIGGFWKVYGKSWQAAQKESGFKEVALSEYNMMNLFVGTGMTVEYGIKGLFAAPVSLFDRAFIGSKKADTKAPSDEERLRSLRDYGNYIENTPFYQYPYFKDIGSYWSTVFNKNKTMGSRLKGVLVGTGMTVEYALKGAVSAPLSYIYGSEALKEDETIHLLIIDEENLISSVDSAIVVQEEFPQYHVKHVVIPRYMQFTETMRKMAATTNITCLNIAGNDRIQVDVKSLKGSIFTVEGVNKLYDIPMPTEPQNSYTAYEVDVKQLLQAIRTWENGNASVLFIHDY